MKAQAYPLSWPQGWPRTTSPSGSQFKTTLHQAMKNVEEELGRFAKDSGQKVESFLISSNFTLGQQNPKDSGVAVYFTWDGIPTCIAVDRYARIEENLQAIFRVIEAERTKLRHGGLNLVRAAFRGYAALPPPSAGGRHWSALLAAGKIHENSVMSARMRGLELGRQVVKTTTERRTRAGRPANVYVTAAVFAQGGHTRAAVKDAPPSAMTAELLETARGAFYDEMRRQGYKTMDIAEIDDSKVVQAIARALGVV